MPTIAESLTTAIHHHQAGRLLEAEQVYRQILAVEPNNVDAWHLLGVIANQVGNHDIAVQYIGSAHRLKPDHAVIVFNLGNALRDKGNLEEAITCYARAVELKADYAEAHYNLGIVLRKQGKRNDAFVWICKAAELNPDLAEAQNSLGAYFEEYGRPDEAVACFRRSLELKAEISEVYHNLGNARKDQARLDDAITSYRRAIELSPTNVGADDNLVYTLHYCPGYDAAHIHAECCRWNDQHAASLLNCIQPHANDRSPDRCLRIGYVSADFREHVLALFEVPLFAAHDHRQFEICCYSNVARPDHITERLRSNADLWRDITALSDAQAADLIRGDQIDVLVDLTMHMEGSRLLVFARKPAPVQVTWLAYPGTTGLTAIDYRLTDPFLDPPGLNDEYYSEESVRLADTFWCYDPLTMEPAVGALPAVAKGHVTFGSLNNFCKVNAGVLKLWAGVLRAVERSQLVLLAPEGSPREWVLQVFQEEGIKPERIVFVGRRPRQQYLELYQQIDIGLDTLPYNGHTTSLDALWMGVPVVTIVGQTVVGRAGLSQLSNLGLTELIAHSPDEFVRIAAKLASDLDRLSTLRGSLRSRMERSPLMDAPRFARSIEAAYRSLWQRWCATKT